MQTNKNILPSPILQPGIKWDYSIFLTGILSFFFSSFSIIRSIILIRKDSGCEINQESYLRHVTKIQQLKYDNSFSSVGCLRLRGADTPVYIWFWLNQLWKKIGYWSHLMSGLNHLDGPHLLWWPSRACLLLPVLFLWFGWSGNGLLNLLFPRTGVHNAFHCMRWSNLQCLGTGNRFWEHATKLTSAENLIPWKHVLVEDM